MDGRCYDGKDAWRVETVTSDIRKTDRNISKCVNCVYSVELDSGEEIDGCDVATGREKRMPKTKLYENKRMDNKMGNVEEKYSVKNISVNLKHYRVTHNKRQMEMAEMLEMNYQNYSKMERGCYQPSLRKFLEVCNRLCVTPNELLEISRKEWLVFFKKLLLQFFVSFVGIIVNVGCNVVVIKDVQHFPIAIVFFVVFYEYIVDKI